MHIDPAVHERFVQEFGLNMLNTLTAKEHRTTAHKRRIHVFDERGGVMGGQPTAIKEFQNLTTGVFHSKRRRVVGVRYRCVPNDLSTPEIGAFHTHPALYDDNIEKVRRRIEQLLWLSEMDKVAFQRQHELYGYEWHFIGCIDIGCFNIHDLARDQFHPRYILRYPRLQELMATLAPTIRTFDRILNSQQTAPRGTPAGTITEIVWELTQQDGHLADILISQHVEVVRTLAKQVATECQLRGLSLKQVSSLLHKSIPQAKVELRGKEEQSIGVFKKQILHSYDALAHLV